MKLKIIKKNFYYRKLIDLPDVILRRPIFITLKKKIVCPTTLQNDQ